MSKQQDTEENESREIFPDTKSMYKAFIDRIPTPIKAPNESSYLEYSRTLTAAKEASQYALKNWKKMVDQQKAEAYDKGYKQGRSEGLALFPKEAVRQFAEMLKGKQTTYMFFALPDAIAIPIEAVDQTLKEFLGEDK